jgi:HJR/Mrr/RecB family endonuclease
MRVPERYRDWPQFWPPKGFCADTAARAGNWPYFEWRSHQVFDLLDILKQELTILVQSFDAEDEVYPDDCDARSICRAWAAELADVIAEWCRLLDVDPTSLPGYAKASRQAVTYARVPSEPMLATMAHLLSQRHSNENVVFRPKCLEQATTELMRWLSDRPTDIDRVHHRTFEAIVGEMIRECGWTIELTKRTRDGGYDIMCLQTDVAGTSVKVVIETKLYRFGRKVGLATVDRLAGAALRDGADVALAVTNSHFSGDVWKRWQHRVNRELSLVDREELLDWLSAGRARFSMNSSLPLVSRQVPV